MVIAFTGRVAALAEPGHLSRQPGCQVRRARLDERFSVTVDKLL